MKIGVLKTESDYNKACKTLYDLDFKGGKHTAAEIQTMEVLTALIEHYQSHKAKFDLPDPVGAIKFAMEQQALKQKDLAGFFGGETRASEVLNHKRPLSMETIVLLHIYLKIPLSSLINDKLNAGFKFEKKLSQAQALKDPKLLQKFKKELIYA
jgi:HTH-type transcriptional regulator/antitoxin HigA